MKAFFVFSGQGAQTVGMGKDLYDSSAAARKVFDEACFYAFFLTSVLFVVSVFCMIPRAIVGAFRRIVAMMYEELVEVVWKK